MTLLGCAGEPGDASGGYDAPWRHFRVGMVAYIGRDNTHATDRRQSVCPSVDAVVEWWEQSGSKQCFTAAHGTPVKIEAMAPARSGRNRWGDPLSWLGPFAKVRAINVGWTGFVAACLLQPNIQVGTVIPMDRDWSDGLTLALHQDGSNVIDLPTDVKVKVLGYYPQFLDRTLFVKILEGAYRNRRGWMGIEDAAPPPKYHDDLCDSPA